MTVLLTLFRAANKWGCVKKALLPKICHTYLKIIKPGTVIPYLKEIKDIYIYINYMTYPFSAADIRIYFNRN